MAKTVTHNDQQQAFFGSVELLEVAQSKSFSQMIFELLSEKEPTADQLRIFELILNISIDHGPDAPSAKKVIEEAQKGQSLSLSLAAGIGEINESHGGAIEPAMKLFYELKGKQDQVETTVKNYLSEGKRMAGFGHRIYEVDPRAQLILRKLKEAGLGEEFIQVTVKIEQELEKQKGKKLPLNIDGAIAVALCAFGWEPKVGNAVFLIARMPGLCGQYLNNS